MTFDEYQHEAMQTASVFVDLDYALGKLCVESGEALQLQWKWLYHGKPYEYAAMHEELGDVLWNLALAARESGTTLDAIAAANIAKLRKRHGDGYNAAYYQEPAQP
jgi:NTP pyrophosphatase (non-canonical NTP hydrolase)